MDAFSVLVIALFLIGTVERITEFVLKPLLLPALVGLTDEERGGKLLSSVLPFTTFLLGALLSMLFGIDLLAELTSAAGLAPVPGTTFVLSAIAIGGGANFLHDWLPTGLR